LVVSSPVSRQRAALAEELEDIKFGFKSFSPVRS
jgi:hypothetical protein